MPSESRNELEMEIVDGPELYTILGSFVSTAMKLAKPVVATFHVKHDIIRSIDLLIVKVEYLGGDGGIAIAGILPSHVRRGALGSSDHDIRIDQYALKGPRDGLMCMKNRQDVPTIIGQAKRNKGCVR